MSDASDALAQYYADLLILQYRGKERAHAHIEALVTPVFMPQAASDSEILPLAVQDGFNLTGSDIAVGAQLDVLGKYEGVTRYGSGPSGPITLSDADFYTLIQLAALKNRAGSSMYDIYALLYPFFGAEIAVFDHQDMRMSYLVSSSLGSQDLIILAIADGLLPKPMAVSLSVVYAPEIDEFFSLRTYEAAIYNGKPLNTYDSYDSDAPWLTYDDAIVV